MYSWHPPKVYVTYFRYVCGKKKQTTFELTALLTHFIRTFTIPMPYLFRRIYYSDE